MIFGNKNKTRIRKPNPLFASWRKKVLALTGGRCAVCGTTKGVQAHHWLLADKYAGALRYCVSNGIPLCVYHHLHRSHDCGDFKTHLQLYLIAKRLHGNERVKSLLLKGGIKSDTEK